MLGDETILADLERRCVYCFEYKTVNLFSREHVVHKAFTTDFQNNLTYGRVCRECNNSFSGFEQDFTRSGPHGLFRFDHGMKEIERFNEYQQGNSVFSVHGSEPLYEGALSKIVPIEGKSGFELAPQISMEKKDGTNVHLSGNYREELEKLVQDGELTGKFSVIGERDEQFEQNFYNFLKGKGWSWQDLESTTPGVQPVFGHFTFGANEFRNISKIGLNYLAYSTESIAPHLPYFHWFDPIRVFVSKGAMITPKMFVDFIHDAAIPFLGSRNLGEGHVVILDVLRISGNRHCLACIISLFQRFVWIVYLDWEYIGPLDIKSAHFWNLESRTVESIDESDVDASDLIRLAISQARVR